MAETSPGPRVSVVIPTYNREHVLPRALASVLSQDFADLEVVIIDDGSRDETPARVAGIADPRVRYTRFDQNRGIGAARSAGVEASRGDLVAFLDSDDRWKPGKLRGGGALLRPAPGGRPRVLRLREHRLRPGSDGARFRAGGAADAGASAPCPWRTAGGGSRTGCRKPCSRGTSWAPPPSWPCAGRSSRRRATSERTSAAPRTSSSGGAPPCSAPASRTRPGHGGTAQGPGRHHVTQAGLRSPADASPRGLRADRAPRRAPGPPRGRAPGPPVDHLRSRRGVRPGGAPAGGASRLPVEPPLRVLAWTRSGTWPPPSRGRGSCRSAGACARARRPRRVRYDPRL